MKYPCKELDFVKWNKVIDLKINDDDTLTLKRLVILFILLINNKKIKNYKNNRFSLINIT